MRRPKNEGRAGGREGGREDTYLLGVPETTQLLHDDAGLVALLVPCEQPPRRLQEEGGAEELHAGEDGSNGEEGPPSILGGQRVGEEVWGEEGREGGKKKWMND